MNYKYYNIGKKKLFPIYRSITGVGNLKTLKIIKREFPKLKIKYFKCNTKVFDWVIPSEWNIKNAYVLDKSNKKIIDFKKNFLHIIGYSKPIKKKISKLNLLKILYSDKAQRDAIPYITSYYKKNYGFCISENQKEQIRKIYKNEDKFLINIDSSFKKNGKMYYGELVLKGKSKQEILVSTYICHPGMANNEISGPIVSMCLIDYFSKIKLNKTIRFIFISETIGSIAYLAHNKNSLKSKCIGGYNLSCIGDERSHSYMLSKNENALPDKCLVDAYKKLKIKARKYSFLARGSDERQYNSPGIDLPVTSIFRSKYGEFIEYHTSLDNFKLVTKKGIDGGYKVARLAIKNLLKTCVPKSLFFCEPNLGKRKLYDLVSKKKKNYLKIQSRIILNFLMYADGTRSLENIAKIIKVNVLKVKRINNILLRKKLITN